MLLFWKNPLVIASLCLVQGEKEKSFSWLVSDKQILEGVFFSFFCCIMKYPQFSYCLLFDNGYSRGVRSRIVAEKVTSGTSSYGLVALGFIAYVPFRARFEPIKLQYTAQSVDYFSIFGYLLEIFGYLLLQFLMCYAITSYVFKPEKSFVDKGLIFIVLEGKITALCYILRTKV